MKVLLQHGAKKETAVGGGATAVHVAAQNGHTEVLRLLLDTGNVTHAATVQ